VTSSFSDGVCVTHDGSGNVVVGGEDGYVAYSTDHGATFTVSALGSSSTEDVFDVATDGSGTWVIVTHFGGEVHRSTDNGATWTRTEASFAYVAGGIIWDGSQFVASGSNGFNQTYFLTSTTGASSSWTANSTGLGIDLTSNNALAYDSVNGDYILFGYDNAGIYTITTTNISTYSNYLFESADSRNVVAITHDSNQDRWIILVSATLNNGGYYSDDDGATWTACTGDIVGSGTNYGIHYCDFLQDTFVGNGNDIARSTDGAAFSYVFTQAGAGGCYAFADNGVDMVVAVGDSSFDHIKSSNSTGGTWTDRNPDTNTDRLQSICYSATEGLWVAVGDDCGIQSSSNGTSWTLEEQNLNTFDGFYYVFYSDVLGQFIAHSATIGVYESSDGLTWAQNDSGANYTFSVSGSYQDAFSYSIYDPGGEDEKEILFATRNTTNPTLYVSSNLKTFNSEIQVAVASVDLYCVKAVADPPPA
jgi:hypothetical protein